MKKRGGGERVFFFFCSKMFSIVKGYVTKGLIPKRGNCESYLASYLSDLNVLTVAGVTPEQTNTVLKQYTLKTERCQHTRLTDSQPGKRSHINGTAAESQREAK